MDLIKIAAEVIGRADRQNPADAVLRNRFKQDRTLSRPQSGQVAAWVFAYYRWFGWLDETNRIESSIRKAEELDRQFEREPTSFSDDDLVERAVPKWVHDVMRVTPAWVRALQTKPFPWLRSRPGHGHALADRLGCSTVFGDALAYTGSSDLFRTPEFQAGEFELQDINSQAVGLHCGPQPGETWWDACAGEGGKTLHLSDLMDNRGLIWATDRAAWRLARLKRRAARARAFNVRMKHWAAGSQTPVRGRFDGVLVDAPCSGIGTWQRNPHARWTTVPGDVHELARIQSDLLARAASVVKPGGKLVYSVCTLTDLETESVAKVFGDGQPEFEPLIQRHPFDRGQPPSGQVWLWPQERGGNGMFIAAWNRSRPV